MAEEVYNAGNADLNNIKNLMDEAVEKQQEKDEKVYGSKPVKPALASLSVDEDGLTEYVTKDMIISDIIEWYPDAVLVLMKCGMHCISCGVSQFETLDQACAVHGLYADDVAKVVNDYLTQTLGGRDERIAAGEE